MELNDLAIFSQVARLGSMSAAAHQLGYVQSNITARVRQLERELHTELFERTARGVKLLPAGERLLMYTDRILKLVEQVQVEFKQPEVSAQPTALRIGATYTITAGYLTEAIWNGQLALEIYTRPIRELIEMLLADQLDGILLNRPWNDKAETAICRFTIQEKVGWAVSAAFTSDQHAAINPLPAQLANYPLLVMRDNDCPYHQATLEYMQRYREYVWNLRPVDTLDMLLTLIRQCKGVAILPQRIVQNDAQSTAMQEPAIVWQPLYVAHNQPATVQIAYYERQHEALAVKSEHRNAEAFAHINDHPPHSEHKKATSERSIDRLRHLLLAGSEHGA
ncbi:LysR family transcriptional regulator [Paenibacillus campi]|uniref:LysR family transcriptional regulator n=1 Tax=Paenibacillus campi TaxID=3106031 RepID=UPI002B001D70|nr:LysR family transcriptional regulator [Paenibacillus sp. SGZ-1009]